MSRNELIEGHERGSASVTTPNGSQSGFAMVGLMVILIAVGGLATVLITRSTRGSNAGMAASELSRLVFVAEAGINYNFVRLDADPMYPVKATLEFTWNNTTKEFESGPLTLQTEAAGLQNSFRLFIQYTDGGVPVAFADRANPVETVTELRVRSSAGSSRAARTVTAWYQFSGYRIGGAIVSDMIPTGPVDYAEDKSNGQLGHVALADRIGGRTQFHVFGDILSNGDVIFNDVTDGVVSITEANALTYLAAWGGSMTTKLAGTDEEIPDFTTLGSAQQLFDFDRFEAAALAGAGAVYANVLAFEQAMAPANALGKPLEGITVIHIDLADSANNPDFSVTVNITGTLIVRFADGTNPLDKVQMLSDCNINKADLSSVVPTNVTTYTSGFPGAYLDSSKRPSAVDISPTYPNFTSSEDVPAMMYNNAILDIHGNANICGVVYAASFLELENKISGIHYLNGAIFSGGGMFIDGGDILGSKTMIRFDPNTVDRLQTLGSGGKASLVRKGYAVSR
jgi:hypothetical protein